MGNPFPVPAHSYLFHTFYLTYISMVLLALSKSATEKMFEIKSEKILPRAGRQTQSIPLNAAWNGWELSPQCSIFALAHTEHCQLTARVDGIDRAFLFGNTRLSLLAPGLAHSHSCLGTLQVSRGLALFYNWTIDLYLGPDTTLVLSGASPVTLIRVVGV